MSTSAKTCAAPAWQATRRYYAFSDYLRERYPFRVYKVTLDAGFTCPNRDGKVGTGGCIYCINRSFSPNARHERATVTDQMERGIAALRARYRARKFIAYFQAYTNTYGEPAMLKRLYDEALAVPDVIGLSVGTRPDCVPAPVLDLLEGYTACCDEVWIEYGLQSACARTLEAINRGHSVGCFFDAVRRTKGRGLRICVHVILGLPGETRDDMMATARRLAPLGIDGIKLHHLYVPKGTRLATLYAEGKVQPLSAAAYADLAAEFLTYLPPTVAVQRLVGDVRGDILIAPRWTEDKQHVLQMVTDALAARDALQGSAFRPIGDER
jgi:radical SAM protein (TIGR01212 family)